MFQTLLITEIYSAYFFILYSFATDIYRCNFDSGNKCNWRDLTDDQFDWSLRKGSTFTTGTGPLTDHTTYSSSGLYIYIETSAPRVQGISYTVTLQSMCLCLYQVTEPLFMFLSGDRACVYVYIR